MSVFREADGWGFSNFLGTPIKDWLDVKRLAEAEGLSIKEFAIRHQTLGAELKSAKVSRLAEADYMARMASVTGKGMVWEAQENMRLAIDKKLIDAAMRPGPIEYVAHRKQQPQIDALRSEAETLRHRQSLLEERVASAERRLAKLRNV